MTYEPQLLAPIEGGGLVTYYKPWLIGREAFPNIQDAYVWRGTVKKREGYSFLANLPFGPVNGLSQYFVPSSGLPQLIAFNQSTAYILKNTPAPNFVNISTFSDGSTVTWTGGQNDFFYSSNFADSLWVTNNIDPLRFWNGSLANGWSTQTPEVNPGVTMTACLMVLPYRGRLVVLNTVEGGTNFFQRARWAQIGTPYTDSVPPATPAVTPPSPYSTDTEGWRDDIPGKGGFIDADTDERIVGAAIVRDTLIVFFQRSTWRLRYVGNEVLPFLWERLNTQYGADSTFASVSFDEQILTYSRYGYIGADTNNVRRIDEKIPDQTFQYMKVGAVLSDLQKVQGIRDFYRQIAYWTYSTPEQSDPAFSNQIIAYNYLDKTWAIFNMSFTVFGYYQTFSDRIWSDFTNVPEDEWRNQENEVWNAPWFQNSFPQIVAGDQYGNVFTVFDTDANDVDLVGPNVGSPPLPVPQPINFIIDTKFLNPYIDKGLRCRLQYLDIYIDSTQIPDPTVIPPENGGQITVELFVDDNVDTPVKTVTVTTSQDPNESKYVRVFLGAIARVHLIRFTLSDTQLADPVQSVQPFTIQGIVLWTRAEGRLRR